VLRKKNTKSKGQKKREKEEKENQDQIGESIVRRPTRPSAIAEEKAGKSDKLQ